MTIDVNVSLFRYPTRRLPLDETAALVESLKASGVTQAWAGSYESLLHHDVAAVNERLAAACGQIGGTFLLPFGTVNPRLPDWEEDLRRCQELYRMPGIRLFPSYHGYGMDSPECARLLTLANDRKLVVQISVRQEDPRTQHRLLSVADVDLNPLMPLIESMPHLRVVVLNGLMSSGSDLQSRLVHAGHVSFEIATLEGVGGIARLLKSVPADRILFGSHAPFFVWESADLKLKESPLPGPVVDRIRRLNARDLIPSTTN